MFKAAIYNLEIPMKQAFSHSQAERNLAESIVVAIQYQGIEGIGECVPRKYVTGENIQSVIDYLMQININSCLSLIDFSNIDAALNSLNNIIVLNINNDKALNAICAFEMAILDLIGKYFGCSIKNILQKYYLPKEFINYDKINRFPTSQVMDFSLSAEEFINTRGPFHTIKIKVNKNLRENVHRIKSIRQSIGYNLPIIIDANMAWSEAEAIENITAFQEFNIAYYEEPLQKKLWINYKNIRKKHGVKILLDESLCSIADAKAAIFNNACDAFNIRISKCGGFSRTAALLQMIYQNGLQFQIGAQVAETGPLIAAGRQLASAIHHYFTYEAGQPDRYFDQYIIDPMPLVNRNTNYASDIEGAGLGVNLTTHLQNYIKQTILWDGKNWTH